MTPSLPLLVASAIFAQVANGSALIPSPPSGDLTYKECDAATDPYRIAMCTTPEMIEHFVDQMWLQMSESSEFKRAGYSVHLCHMINALEIAKEMRKTALECIQNERKYARQSGVVNLSTLSSCRANLEYADQDIQEAKERVADARRSLREAKLSPMACNGPLEADLDCTYSDPPDYCKRFEFRFATALFTRFEL